VPIDIAPSIKDGPYKLGITVAYQTCNDRLCLPPREEELALNVYVGDPPIGIAAISSALEPPSKTNAAMPAARVPDMARLRPARVR